MYKKIIVISGPISSGKSTLAKSLEEKFGSYTLKTSELLQNKYSISDNDRLKLQQKGEDLDNNTNGRWVLDELSRIERLSTTEKIFVVDSVRTLEQIKHIRKAYGSVTHLHLSAPSSILQSRYDQKYGKKKGSPSYSEAKKSLTEQNVTSLEDIADVVINTDRCKENDVFVRSACRMCLYGKNENGYVDIIIGAQYGSEGKGQIAGFLAKEYDLLVRVGGPNAGHTVYEEPEPYVFHHLPSGTRKCDAKLVLAPGMVINIDKLLEEIAECTVECDRLSIDPHAMIISKDDIKDEKGLQTRIASTGQGVGQATARKILDRGNNLKLAKDVPELAPYVRSTLDILMESFANNKRILVEGTQGTCLSIHHGTYPFVTSRDTTVSGCLSEAGIPPSMLRRVIMVCRTYPIRVAGPSGPMAQEISWSEISRRSGISVYKLRKREKTSTTHRQRRVGEFNWDVLKKSAVINGATDIALTFVDYLSPDNKTSMRFDQLTKETRDLIEEIELVTKARVSLVGTGFNSRSIIDRREW